MSRIRSECPDRSDQPLVVDLILRQEPDEEEDEEENDGDGKEDNDDREDNGYSE